MIDSLGDAAVRDLITAADAVRLVWETFTAQGRGEIETSTPPAMSLRLSASPSQSDGENPTARRGGVKLKAAALPLLAGVRIAVDPGSGLVSHCVLVDPNSGAIGAVVAETWLHRLRTAASAAVAAALLLPATTPQPVVALVGTGLIADELPAALALTTAVGELRVAARSSSSAERFAQRHRDRTPAPIRPCASVAEAAAGADLVVLLTSAAQPVLRAEMLPPGATVLGLGGGAELAVDVLYRSDRFFVDDLEFATMAGSAAGWLAGGLDDDTLSARLTGTLGQLATAAVTARTEPGQTVLGIVQGLAACDVALAGLAWQRSRAQTEGRRANQE